MLDRLVPIVMQKRRSTSFVASWDAAAVRCFESADTSLLPVDN
jgi:hypothetical protein